MQFDQIVEYIKSDLYRYTEQTSFKCLISTYFKNRSFSYSFWFRFCKSSNKAIRFTAKVMHFRLSRKYGIQIPANTNIGHGLYIGHGMALVLNSTARIGCNVNLSQFTTIGSNHGLAATIGNNCYIGPNVCVVEDVCIGNNVTIGAGAVVTRDIPDNSTAAGVPAKVIPKKMPGRYVANRWPNCNIVVSDSEDNKSP